MTFGILTPDRFIEAKDPIQFKVRAEGIYTISAVKNGAVIRSRKFRNLITDLGLDRLATASQAQLLRYCFLGVGTTAPEFTDVALGSQVAGSITMSGSVTPGSAPDYVSRLITSGTSSIGQFGNSNLTEIGVGGSSGTNLFSRALILDTNGQPAAFPITDEEQLQVSYEVRLYPPLEDAIYEVEFDGIREAIVRPASVTNSTCWGMPTPSSSSGGVAFGEFFSSSSGATRTYWHTGDLGPVTGAPSGGIAPGGFGDGGTATTDSYVTGSHKISGRYSWSASAPVSNSLRSQLVRPGTACYFQVQYDPPLQKTDEQTMYCEYEVAWGRHDP